LSYSIACATSVWRVIGGSHFATDVLIGAAVGTATGFVIPFLHTKNSNQKKSDFVASVLPTGVNFEIWF